MLILDTDHMSLMEWRDSEIAQRIIKKLETVAASEVWTTIISFEEQVRGWMGALSKAKKMKEQIENYRRLATLLKLYCGYQILDFTEQAAIEFQRLRKEHPRLPTMDLKIASIALAHKATLLTRNTRDFRDIKGLVVEDWTLEAPQ